MTQQGLSFGTPSAIFLPVGNYKLNSLTELVDITMPIVGTFREGSPRAGESYNIIPEDGVVLFGVMLEVMLYNGFYPTLGENHRFVIAGLDVSGATITVVGRIVEIVEE